MLHSEYICEISGMEEPFTGEWEQDPSSCSLGYSTNKSMEWFYCCIDWKNCAASTK